MQTLPPDAYIIADTVFLFLFFITARLVDKQCPDVYLMFLCVIFTALLIYCPTVYLPYHGPYTWGKLLLSGEIVGIFIDCLMLAKLIVFVGFWSSTLVWAAHFRFEL